MPALDLRVRFGQFVMSGVKEIAKHSEEVEIHEAGAVINQKLAVPQHLFERAEPLFKLVEQFALLRAPMIQTAAPELALLVPDEEQPVGLRDEIAPMDVREFEARPFDVVLDVSLEDGLKALKFCGEQAERKFLIQILGDDLRIVVQLEHDVAPVTNDRHPVVTFLGELPNQSAVAVGDVGDFEPRSGEFQDATLDDAERTPRKLNQLDHFKTATVPSTAAI